MLAYVINKHGKPLMPCHPAKARQLLKESKARVFRRTPFTIQLLYGSSGYKQPVRLGKVGQETRFLKFITSYPDRLVEIDLIIL